jgi:hypothetical protein
MHCICLQLTSPPTIATTTVKIGSTVIGTTVDFAAAGVRAVLPKEEEKN